MLGYFGREWRRFDGDMRRNNMRKEAFRDIQYDLNLTHHSWSFVRDILENFIGNWLRSLQM